jgi:polyhydroxyalkanoate synthesis regulator phasin
MKHDSVSARLALKAGFLTTLAERAIELAEAIDSLASAHEWVEDLKEEIEDALADTENFTAEEVEALRSDLAKKEARLADKRKQVDLLEARLRNFKDDVTCLGETL